MLPTAIEGDWVLKDAEGKTIASSKDYPGAQLSISPWFYKGQTRQTALRSVVSNKKGRKVSQVVRVSAAGGRLAAEAADATPKPVTPKFDRLGATASISNDQRTQTNGS